MTAIAGLETLSALVIGQLAGKYRLIELIGRGGVGEVFRAEHDITGDVAAVKVLVERIGEDDDALEAAFDEARAATRIGHPAIARVLDYGRAEGGAAYVATELLEGESLLDRISRVGQLGLAKSLGLGQNLAEALAAAHASDITHGDLKPSSVFIASDADSALGERAVLLDFGIARLVGRGATGEAELGTAGFMAPERCRGQKPGAPADVYALGCLLYRMLSARSAVDGSRAGGFTVAHINQTAPLITDLVDNAPVTLAELIAAMLEKEPEERPGARAVAAKLGRIVDLVEALVSADAAAANLGEAETAIAPATGLYAEDEATVLDRGSLARDLDTTSDETVDSALLDDDDEPEAPGEHRDKHSGRRTPSSDVGGAEPADEDIEVDLPAPAARRRDASETDSLEEPPTLLDLGADAADISDLPAPVAREEDIEDLPAPVPAARMANLPAPLPAVRAGKTPPPEPLIDPPTEEDMLVSEDPLEEVLGLPSPVTFRSKSAERPVREGGDLALLKDGDNRSPAPSGQLALLGAADDPAGKSERQQTEAKPAKRVPKRKPSGKQPSVLGLMIEDSALGDDAPTMIVPGAIDVAALEDIVEEEDLPPRVPMRVPSSPGGTSLPDLGEDDEPLLPPEWIKWGTIGAAVVLVLVIFLVARSCDDGATGGASPERDASVQAPD